MTERDSESTVPIRGRLAPIATLLDLFRVGGLTSKEDFNELTTALEDETIVATLGVSDAELADIKLKSR